MPYPANLKYSRDHVWIDVDVDDAGDRARVGITDFAQKQLGDVVYVDLPAVGTTVKEGQSFGTIESATAASDLYAPVSGEVVKVNGALNTWPERLNTDPHGNWLIVLKVSDSGEADGLLDAGQYADLVK